MLSQISFMIFWTIWIKCVLASGSLLEKVRNFLPVNSLPFHANIHDILDSDKRHEASKENDNNLDAMIGVLSSNYYFGEWEAAIEKPIPNFSGQKGYSYFHHSSLRSLSFNLHIYDGYYVDEKTITIFYDDLNKSFSYDNSSGTLTFENVSTTYRNGDYYETSVSYCPTNIIAHFINIANNQPFQVGDEIQQFGMQIEIQSDTCSVYFSTSLMTKVDELFDSQILPYGIIIFATSILECLILLIFDKDLDKNVLEIRRVIINTICDLTFCKTSPWTIIILNAFNLYILLMNSSWFLPLVPPFEILLIPNLFIVFCYQPRITWKILQVQREFFHIQDNYTREAKIYFCLVLMFLCVLASFVVSPNLPYLLYSISFVPQISQNFQLSLKHKWNFWVLGGLSIQKIFFIVYTKVDPNNLLRISPDWSIIGICVIFLLFQLIILGIQTKWPRFGFEKKTGYYIHKQKGCSSYQDLCAICLERLKDSFGSSGSSQSFIGTDTTLIDRRKILTPCRHEFHLFCLRQWLSSKLECPYCRKALPQLPEEYIED